MNISIHKQIYQCLLHDFDTLNQVKVSRGDKLAVIDGALANQRGSFYQAPMRTIQNFFYPGYRSSDVIKHLEGLALKTESLASDLLCNPSLLSLDNKTELTHLIDRISRAKRTLASLEKDYKKEVSEQEHKKIIEVYSRLSNFAKTAKKQLGFAYWEEIPKSALQKKPLDFNARVDIQDISYSLPKDQTIEETLALAQIAQAQIPSPWKKIAATTLFRAAPIAALPLMAATLVKWGICDTIEYALTGKVVTQTPLDWWQKSTIAFYKESYDTQAEAALARYAAQLLNPEKGPITSLHIEAFCSLAHTVEEVRLEMAYLTFFDTVRRYRGACPEARAMVLPLQRGPGISDLTDIINAVGKHKCHTFVVPEGAHYIPKIGEALVENGFKQQEGCPQYYTRSALRS